MSSAVDNSSYIVLIDDDGHSARLLTRMLLAHGAPRLECFSDATQALSALSTLPTLPAQHWPDLVLVDLKAHSAANLDFVTALAPVAGQLDIPVAVMAQPADSPTTDALHEAGAAAVFTRHPDIEAYRREAAKIVSFWVRNQHLDAVGM